MASSTARIPGHKKHRWLFTLVSFGLMLGISGYVVARNWPAGGIPWLAWRAHAVALAAVSAEILTRAFKIKASARSCGEELSFATALRVCLAGDFAAAVTPARSGAEPARFLVLRESGMPAASRVLVLFLELFLEMWSLLLVCLLLAWLFHGRGASTLGLLSLVGGYSSFVLGLGAAGWLLSRHSTHGPPPYWLRKLGAGAGSWRRLQGTLRDLRSALRAMKTARPLWILLAFGGSILHVLFKVSTLPILVFLGDPGFALSRDSLAPLVLWPLALFYGGVVVPAPGGGGFIEGAFAATLSNAIPPGLFVAALLWWRFYTFYLYLLIGGLAAGGAAMRAIGGGSLGKAVRSD